MFYIRGEGCGSLLRLKKGLKKTGDRFCKSFIIYLRKFDVYLQYNITWVGNPNFLPSQLRPFPPKWKRVRKSNNRSRSGLSSIMIIVQ